MMSIRDWREFNRAEDALWEIDPEQTDDETLMALVADWLTAGRGPRYHLNIMHDARPSAARERARILKYHPDYKGDPYGPCPVYFHWYHKNIVGIDTTDCETARQWAIEAMRHGYAVSYSQRSRGAGGGLGSLAAIRERARERKSGRAIT
jgi:hypothetical protein